jgi:hypothetical protein
MNPVIGLDVCKGESHAQAFIDRGKHHGKTFGFKHELEGLASFLRYAPEVDSYAGMRPAGVLEIVNERNIISFNQIPFPIKHFIISQNILCPQAPIVQVPHILKMI